MSNVTYEEMLREAMVELREQLEMDQQECGRRYNRREDFRQYLRDVYVPMYVRYLMLFRKLEQCYDLIQQPQKRQDVRVVLDATMGRMLEVKRHIIRDCGDFASCDDVLVDLKVTPDTLEVPIPKYFVEERKRELDDRRKLYDTWQQSYPQSQQQVLDKKAPEDDLPQMDIQEAIRVLQCNERGRQGRLRAKFMREIRDQEDRERKIIAEGQIDSDPQESATKIQKHFKGYQDRKKCREMRQQELEFLGMAESEDLRIRLQAQKEKLDLALQRRKLSQDQNRTTLAADRESMRKELKDQEGGQVMEELHDQLLERIIKAKCAETADGPVGIPWNEFPSEENGGSLNPEWLAGAGGAVPADINQSTADMGKDAKKGAKKGKDGKKGKDAKGGKKGGDDEEDQGFITEDSKFFSRMHEGTDRYSCVWQAKFDRTDFYEKYDKDLLRSEIKEGPGGLDAELRGYVDALIRVEIKNLELSVLPAKKKGKGGGKGGKKGKDKKGKDKKGKGDAGDKAKGQDPFNMSRELFWMKWMSAVPETRVQDYVGAHNLLGKIEEDTMTQPAQSDANAELAEQWEELLNKWREQIDTDVGKAIQKQIGMDFDSFDDLYKKFWKMGNPSTAADMVFEPSMAQVRQAVTEYCILPLGSQTIYDLVDTPLYREEEKPTTGKKKGGGPLNGMTALFFGPPLSGKTLMSHAVATETGSLFFDLTPDGPAFQDPRCGQAQNLKQLMAMVFEVATAWSPAVIYINNVDLFFAKKKGKAKNPELDRLVKVLKKELMGSMKNLKPIDRVLVLGNMRVTEDMITDKPADNAKRFQEIKDFFKVMVYFPHPDYSSRLLLWQHLIKKFGGPKASLPNDYDYELLSYMTNKCTSGTIASAITKALTQRRVRRIVQRPLRAEEFLAPLAQAKPVTEEEWRRYHDFVRLMPLGPGRRFNPNEGKEDGEEDPKGKKGKKGKKR
eukprot:TRINITY_DN46982_c0_g1_i1.p1 TRINITY_DN46982_c0_g1~~TRINITY_DN46982_c0_g1_i1.p1  ORF type:complete len:955 (+),score=437.24 TRINITY_DN46982_c0_g1_i1:92-2956(+)